MDYNLDSIYENIYEYYINDYIIFEGILRRDYMECIGVLNENKVTDFFKGIWNKMKEIFEWIKEKITELIDKIFKKGKKEKLQKTQIINKFNNLKNKEKLKKINHKIILYDKSVSTQVCNQIKEYENIIFEIDVRNIKSSTHNIDITKEKNIIKQSILNNLSETNYPFKFNVIECIKNCDRDTQYYRYSLIEMKNVINITIKDIEDYIKDLNKINDYGDKRIQSIKASNLLYTANTCSKLIIYGYNTAIEYNEKIEKQYIRLLAKAINYIEGTNYTFD